MCGFIGYIVSDSKIATTNEIQHLENMTEIISHRGPNDSGYFVDNYVRFGFRRLSIIDIEGGNQPLSYENERYWIIFNGEIYNYIELREELQELGYDFKTQSDTEVVISLFSHKREESFKDLRGMFSFLIWDKHKKELFGARDHFGIKPFFYLNDGSSLYCASEMKSITYMKNTPEINAESLHHYLTYQFVPEPFTMNKNIKKLQPGHYFIKKQGKPMEIKTFWQPSFHPENISLSTAKKEIQNVLRDSVKKHMRADVPVGAFLSGGIDSSSIVALASEFHPNLKTFTVGFEREGFSEIDLAILTAEELNVEHIHYLVQPEDFLKELPKIIWQMDEPVADPAAVPLYFVAREASKHVKVVLSGEGADELFGGYNIYHEPNSLRHLTSLPSVLVNGLTALAKIFPEGVKGKNYIERGSMSLEERYIGNAKMFSELEKRSLLTNYNKLINYQDVTRPLYNKSENYHDVHKMQFIDLHTWLRGDILVKADKMTMAHSLELRVPFLDKEVFEVASRLHPNLTVTNGTTKYALREAMKGIVPDSVLKRRKLGFPVPIRHWLKNEMFDWARELIISSDTNHLLNKTIILKMLEDHCQDKADYSRKLWTILIFMLWHQIYIEKVIKISDSKELVK
ncbi:asparagine synthase (glutamine-hydrolyzing) [Peribacillus frigoritolerans]|uniref:asparagine synthase (glutamine-hydrolyzing) n=1 Tax=Peribacillus frigoritolerans TaxID=450367 RepID=UPI001059B850|nr:asparagine synthase (glutamine-hydrolyzing) [Peribacillus frigoritolerans]TDL74899.1 asparagine synthase (glutamine-hydrolyzing) [Peribacillus frigoritolerans]